MRIVEIKESGTGVIIILFIPRNKTTCNFVERSEGIMYVRQFLA
jgi:hypothetical protein